MTKLIGQAGHTTWEASVADRDTWAAYIAGTDLLFTLGGDGTILRAAPLCGVHSVPMVGVKFGRLGFLTEVLPEHVEAMLPRFLNKEFWIEERSLLSCRLTDNSEWLVLNEAVISHGRLRRIISMRMWVDDTLMATYVADGLIISTATGSTAYSMVAGGPILHPDLRSILITPICAFRGPTTPFVVPETAHLRLQVFHQHEATLTLDGLLVAELPSESTVDLSIASQVCYFARLQSRRYFYETLVNKLQLPVDGP